MADLTFDCIGAQAERYAVLPTITLALRVSETSGQRVDAIALRCQIRIEPSRRRYTPDEEERLRDLFGETTRWADTLKPMQFTTVSTMISSFSGHTEIELPVNFSYDLEIGSGRYFASLEAGEIPLLLLFSGTIFSVVDGRMQVQQVPWSKEASYRLPVSVWREAVDVHFPNMGWIAISRETLSGLERYKTERALPTWDATLNTLLGEASEASGAPDSSGGPS
ncbi:MAG: hypothetical protein JO016_07650 [Actinobacteria bacterium]|nr:hypothetical protein [Actinomycetota bacterium]